MDYERFNQFCNAFPATTYVKQWGDSHVWKVGGKVFAVGGWGPDKGPAFTFKTSNNNFEFLKEVEGYRPAPYFASRGMKWMQHIADKDDLDKELHYYLSESYRLVSLGLTKVKQKELGLNQ
jgi:predicted DNA-binding protein (MmcQ/YjbR family)